MKLKLFLLLTLIFTSPTASVKAHWEDHDLGGQYLYGYAAVGDNPEVYMTEIENNRIPTNVQSLAVNTPLEDLAARIG